MENTLYADLTNRMDPTLAKTRSLISREDFELK